jgi:hypothetical protein
MAKLYITEYFKIGRDGNSLPIQSGLEDGSTTVDQTPISFSTSTQSAALNAKTVMVRVHTDSICSIAFGTNPTATTNNKRLAANTTEYFSVDPGKSLKIAVITNT